MSRAPLYALTAAVSLIAAVLTVPHAEVAPASAEVPPAPPLATTPTSTGIVLAGAVEASVLTDLEARLTEEAAARSTSTTSTTTTTLAVQPVNTTTATRRSNKATSSTADTTTTTTTTTKKEPSGGFDSAAESQFASSINSLRSSNGKPALSRNGSLDSRARDWSKYMAENGSLSHSNLSSLIPPWSSVGENVGAGGSVSEIFALLESSSGHRSNMLGDFTHMGIGVWRDANGTLWTTHVFAR